MGFFFFFFFFFSNFRLSGLDGFEKKFRTVFLKPSINIIDGLKKPSIYFYRRFFKTVCNFIITDGFNKTVRVFKNGLLKPSVFFFSRRFNQKTSRIFFYRRFLKKPSINPFFFFFVVCGKPHRV
jgi:hypothetical protein